ncbi:MAG: Mrp/NBP35 family ATP-binding protein [Candidatus Aminicenantes bacterium]|nr:Mrp/NBP35 family ATP-binding protein [Candidatus Aminicenantes bacterium]
MEDKSKLYNDMALFDKIPVSAKKVIAVASGKGGVGKSTVTVNLALALASKGYKVGIMDADIYGPNVPLMLGVDNVKVRAEGEFMIPIEKFGIQIMSVGFITDREKALIWRGALANKLIEQFFRNVKWGELDIMLIDLPPGTGDVPLSILQKVKLDGGIIVTTPQEASIADVLKMINMFKADKIETEILGIVENMKYLICAHCNEKTEMFPISNPKNSTKSLGYKILAEFPFDNTVGLKKDNETPYYIDKKETLLIKEIDKLADETVKAINLKKK